MTDIETIFFVIALQQTLYAVAWGLAGSLLALSRAATFHWMGFCLLSAVAPLLGFLGEVVPRELARGLGNLSFIVALMLVRRGIAVFLHQPSRDREQAVLLVALVALHAVVGFGPEWFVLRASVVSVAVAWIMVNAGLSSARQIRSEFGSWPAWIVSGPMLAIGVAFSVRAALVLGMPQAVGTSVSSRTDFNLALLLSLVGLSLMFNVSLAYMVVSRLVRKLNYLSRHDSLTGLLNRRAMEQALRAEQRRWLRFGEHFAVLLVDLDHFKRINDSFGHAAGDAVLKAVAQTLVQVARQVDRVGRFGGEEFCLLLPHTPGEGAELVARRVRQAVAELEVVWEGGSIRLTASVGVAACAHPEEPVSRLMMRADRALYQAKAEGRDRVVLAPAPGTTLPTSAAA
jgi:diguanylate cyclase (GGDEF)-like protein